MTRRNHVEAGEVTGIDLRRVARIGEKIKRARAEENAALDELADAILDAHPERRRLLLVEKLTGVARTTLRRRLHDRTIARREANR